MVERGRLAMIEKQLRQLLEDVRIDLVKVRWIRGKPAPTK
jgi:hypothetical protein